MKKLIAVAGPRRSSHRWPLVGAGTASAYPGALATDVCAMLDNSPSVATINQVFDISYSARLESYAAGAQLDASVQGYCPRHLGLVNYYRAQSGQPPLPGYYYGSDGGSLA